MATITHGGSTVDTSNTNTYTTAAFTPAANDLLVSFVFATATVLGTMNDSWGLGWTRIGSSHANGSADSLFCFISNALTTATSGSVQFRCVGDNATGCILEVARISGMTRTGASAALQFSGSENIAAGLTPGGSFAVNTTSGNPLMGFVGNASNPAGLTPPSGYTELKDEGYNTPSTGLEYVGSANGLVTRNITWGGTSATAFGTFILELDTSAVPVVLTVPNQLMLTGAGI